MRINLLPEDKKANDGAVAPSGPRQVPMSTPVPVDNVATHQPIELTPSTTGSFVKNEVSVPVARKYSTIDTTSEDKNEVKVMREVAVERLDRDRSGRPPLPVFASRKIQPKVEVKPKVVPVQLPNVSTDKIPDKMMVTDQKDLDPSIKGNLLREYNADKVSVESNTQSEIKVPEPVSVVPAKSTTIAPSAPKKVVRTTRREWGAVGFILLIFLAVGVSIGGWWLVLRWNDQTINLLTENRDNLARQVVEGEMSTDVGLRLQAQLEATDSWLQQTRDYSDIFNALEIAVLPTSTFVALDVQDVGSFVVYGETGNMEDVARQFTAFVSAENVKDVYLIKSEMQSGVAMFEIQVSLNL